MKFALIPLQDEHNYRTFDSAEDFLDHVNALKKVCGDHNVKTNTLLWAIEYITKHCQNFHLLVSRELPNSAFHEAQSITIRIISMDDSGTGIDAKAEFRSPVNMENSFGAWRISDDARSQIHFNFDHNRNHAWFEWELETGSEDNDYEDDMYEEGSLQYEGKNVTGYDGVFELPAQLILLLDVAGFNTEEVNTY